jgi:hypothetical protein
MPHVDNKLCGATALHLGMPAQLLWAGVMVGCMQACLCMAAVVWPESPPYLLHLHTREQLTYQRHGLHSQMVASRSDAASARLGHIGVVVLVLSSVSLLQGVHVWLIIWGNRRGILS